MTQEIIDMARQADLIDDTYARDWYIYQLQCFAKLVEDAAFKRWAAQTKLAVQDEREACAKVCDDLDKSHWGCEVRASWCSKAIRARGEA
jgi:hypothetical protein